MHILSVLSRVESSLSDLVPVEGSRPADRAAMQLQLISVPYRYDEPNEGLGLGPGALLEAGLAKKLTAAGFEVMSPVISELADSDRDEGRTAVNIGKLGASTSHHVSNARKAGHAVLVLSGDDTAAVGVVAGLQAAEGAASQIGLVWLDAHGDFNTPETSYSGILAGMPVAIIAGIAGPQWRAAAGLAAPIPTDRILIAGVRDLDEKEEALLLSTSVRLVRAENLRTPEQLAPIVERLASHCSSLVLHIDLDVLDPHLVPSSSTPSAGGLEIDQAVAAIQTVLATGKVAVVSVSSLNPGAGQRGQRSIQTTLTLLERSLSTWKSIS